ncbi:MAG TPA: patatin-like phospholipase family protein [Terriglobales bacterium]
MFLFLQGFTEQAMPIKKYPKVGLVLEGGGALGLAHIGVLLWLEEHHIPASYIAGTTMGGLVGGFYATGLSAPEVREKVNSIDWNAVLAGGIPFQDLAFRRKEDAVAYPSSLEFGLRNGLRFPEAFNSGQKVSFILDQVALPYSDMKTFDDLPTPFGCVATDLVSNRTWIFRSGSLAVALRATMSLPGIFTPVRTEKQILADGGLLDNLPVDVVKNMGAELTLAIHLETAPLKPDAQLSLFGVLRRSISTVVASNELRSMELADIVVSVPLDGFSSTDYNRADEIIKVGYDAAANKAAILSTMAVDDATWQQYLANREARQRSAPIPEFVAVTGTGPHLARDIEHEMTDVNGNTVNASEMQERILYLQGLGRFNNLSYQMTDRNGQPGLLIMAEEKQYAPPVVRPLILVDGSDFLNPTFNLGARITFLDVGGFRSEWRNDVIIGSQYGITSEYYHPFHPDSNWFVSPQAYASNSNFPVYDQNTLIANYRQGIVGGGGDVGYIFGRTAQLRFGYQVGNESLRRRIGNAELPNVSGRFGFTRLQFQLDTQNSNTIATSGNAILFRTDYFDANPGAPHGFPLSEVASYNNVPLNHLTSAYLNGFAGTTYGNDAGIPPFSLGGTVRLAAWGTNALLTNQYFLFQTGVLRQLAQLPPFLGGGLFFNARFEVGKAYDISHLPTVQGDVVGAFEVNTIFGPVMVGGAIGNAGHQKFFFRIGRLF